MSRFSSVCVGAAVAAILSFASAGAGPAAVTVSAAAPTASGLYQVQAMAVTFADVDISTADGAATVFGRIDAASRTVCGERAGRKMTDARAKLFERCRVQTVRDAVKTLGIPSLTQLAASR